MASNGSIAWPWNSSIARAPIDIAKLAEYRLQLIGEAAKYQSAVESVVLDESLWGDAGIEQEQRRTKDPWEGMLEHLPIWWDEIKGYDADRRPVKGTVLIIHISGAQELVSAATLLKHVLDIPISHQTTVTAMRLSTVMKQLGWQRHKNGYVSISNHDRVKGYFRELSEDNLYARRALELQRPAQTPQP
jgi:hypothetical protein